MILDNEQKLDVLRRDGKKLSDWIRDNFNHYAELVITAKEVRLNEDLNKPTKEQ